MPPHGSPKAGQAQLSPTKPGGKSPEKGHRRPPLKYPKLVADKGPDTTKLPPSEMLFPSEEAGSATVAAPRIVEFLNIADYTHNVSTVVPVEEPLFQPSPMHILFKSFEPQQVYTAKLCFRNNDYVGRRMKIQEIRSAFFHVKRDLGDDKGRDKVAPGMEVSYTITFTPQDPINYEYDMVVVTEREKFIVPLKALGPRPRFDFPDLVEFPSAPVRVETSKVLLVRNVGNASGSFTCTAAEPFFISPQTCVLEPQEAVQVTVTFFPDDIKDINSDIKIQYSSDEVVYMKVAGTVQELDVGLEASIVEMDNTYVTLFSQKTFKIFNKSDLPVQFEFKSLSSAIEDEKARARFRSELSQSLPDFVTDVEFEQYEEDVASMPLHFEDSAFKFEPVFGEVWPGCTRLVQITFSPIESVDYSATAFLQVQGKEARLPLQLSGSGIGAKLFLSHTVLSVGEVIVRTENEYEFWLENLGDIPATFEYAPQDTSIAPRFTFTPSSGLAAVGAKIKVKAVFYPEQRHLGDFEEPFQWFIQGSPKPRIITFRGKVVTPTFYLDSDMLDYGRVSAGFLQSRSFNIFNTSPVPFRFHCRIPGDGVLLQREFDPVPETGVVLPGGKHAVRVDFVSTKTGLYDLAVDIDLEGVGESLQRLPIVANSVMPDVAPNVSAVNFGECFLQYEHKKFIELINSSDLPVKFDVVPQDTVSASVAKITVDQLKGTIMGKKELLLCVTMCVKRLGKLQLPLKIRVVGMESRPLEVVMSGIGIGPRLEIPSDDINWGNIPVLQSTKSDVIVRNTGLISAHIRPIVGKKGGPFTIPATHKDILLEPNVEVAIPVFAYLNDCSGFKDQLVLMVDDGPDVKISLNAKGTGTTLWCDHQLSHVELGPNFSQRPCQHSFVLVNRGPKAQTLTWSNEEDESKKKEKKDSKDAKDDEGPKSVFRIEPDKGTLEPGANMAFTIMGLSPKEGFQSQKILGKVSVERAQMVAFEMLVDSHFINPLLQMSKSLVSYSWTYTHESPFPHPLQESITVTNISKLSLSCILKTAIPFSCHPEDIFLEPGASTVVSISFEPGWKGDHCSVVTEGKLQFAYKEHPQKDSVSLVGNVVFPNLNIAQKSVEFGTILSDTSKRNLLRVVNNEPIDVTYSWSLSVDEGYSDEFPIGNIFDIVPSRAILRPGEVQDVEVIFQSQKEKKFECFAVASVVGGPTYELKLKGSGGQIKYTMEPSELSLGGITFDKPTETEIVITNSGKVKIDFSIDTSSILPPSFVVCTPSSGIVNTSEKVKVAISVTPGTPDAFEFDVMVRIAHYSPVPLKIKCQGVLPMLIFDLSRKNPALHAERLALAIAKLGPKPDAFDAELNGRKEATSAPPSRPATQGSKRSNDRLSTLRYIRLAETEADLLGMRSHIHSQAVANQHKLTHSRLNTIVESSSVATFDVGDPRDLEDVPPFIDAAESQTPREEQLPPRAASTVPVVPAKQLPSRVATAMRHHANLDDMLLSRKQITDAIEFKKKEVEELRQKIEIQKNINPAEARKLLVEFDRKEQRLASLRKDLDFVNIGIFVINAEDPEVLDRDFKRLDNNGNGIVSLSEVQTWLTVNYPFLNQRQVIAQAFHLSKNESGFVTEETFASLWKHLGQGIRAIKFFNQMDSADGGDKKINQAEFIEAVNRLITATQGVQFEDEVIIAEFNKIDANGGGEILFSEFYNWLEHIPSEETAFEIAEGETSPRPVPNLAGNIKSHLDAMVKPVSLADLNITPRQIPSAGLAKKRLTTSDVAKEFFASEYVCDFGHIIKGATKKRVFSASNTSAVPVNFELDKKSKQDCKMLGFAIDPEKMNKFPGGPDAESIDVSITFNSAAKEVPMGRVHYPLQIQIKNGPKICIHLEAFVTIPEVSMNVESIAFGSLMCGRSKIHTIQLTNIKTVPCDWSFSEAIDGVRACQAITARPSSGTLHPGDQVNVEITFSPSQSKVINAKMMLKVNANQVKKTLKIKAQGVEPLVTFEPAHLTFKPILPVSGLSVIDVAMINSCSEELEVVCSELDSAIAEEEELLRTIDCFGSEGSILLPVRMPGQPLPRAVTEWVSRKKAIAAAAAAAASEAPAADGDAADGVGEVSVLATTSPRGDIFLVHGKPSLNPAALASSISAKFRVPALTIDEIVAESIASGSESALALVASLEAAAKAAAAPVAAAPVDPKAKGKAPAPAAPVEEAKVETVSIGGSDVAKVATLSDEVSDHLRALVRSRLERDDCSLGAVLHSVGFAAVSDNAALLNMLFMSLTKDCGVILVTPNAQAAPANADDVAAAQGEEAAAPQAESDQPAVEVPAVSDVDEQFNASSAAMDAVIQQAKDRAAARPSKDIDWAGLVPLDSVAAAPDAVPENVPDLAVISLEVPVTPVDGDFSAALQALVDDCVLPLPEPLPGQRPILRIPAPVVRSILPKIPKRVRAQPSTFFELLALSTTPAPAPAEGEEPSADVVAEEKMTRWVMKPGQRVQLRLKFSAKDCGDYDAKYNFEIVGAPLKSRDVSLSMHGVCAFPTISDDYRTLYYRKVKQHPANGIVHRQFVLTPGVFDFGPLILGKTFEEKDKFTKSNSDKFRITNTGLFDLKVKFDFEKSGSPFTVEPSELELGIDECRDVVVWAFPTAEVAEANNLVCVIEHNPKPVVLPVSCSGCKPSLTLDPADGSLKFDRLLVKRKDTKTITLSNPTQLPVKWAISGVEALAPELFLSDVAGTLEPLSKKTVEVSFTSPEPKKVERTIKFIVSDAENLFGAAQELPVKIEAEAYHIEFDLNLPKGQDKGVDFGTVRVSDKPVEQVLLQNKGLYAVGYSFQFKKASTGKYFTFSSQTGTLEPGAKDPTPITINFACTDEIELKDNTDLRCLISEATTGEVILPFTIKINVQSVFSMFKVMPSKGVNFGAVLYNTSKQRTFDIVNNGVFDFQYKIVDWNTPPDVAAAPADAAPAAAVDPKAKGAPPAKGAAPAAAAGSASLTMGAFSMTPASGIIAPGSSAAITVNFDAKGAQVYSEKIAVRIAQASGDYGTVGDLYELVGESCVPGISTSDWDTIFEEQEVVRRADASVVTSAMFFAEERSFNFGPVVVGTQSEQRFRITNPFKIPCTVDFAIKPARAGAAAAAADPKAKGGAPAAGGDPLTDGSAFEVQPSKLSIPTHEFRYVTVYFNPKSLETMSGKFEAVVDGGSDAKTNSLAFSLRGDGILPRIKILQPSETDADGRACAKFGRLLVGKSVSRQVVILNDGIIPASVRVDTMVAAPPSIQFTGRGAQFKLAPGEKQEYELTFNPREAGAAACEIKIAVQQNQFEDSVISVSGDAYERDLSFEDLGGSANSDSDKLVFGGTPVCVPVTKTFNIQNRTSKSQRFEWPSHDSVSFVPRLGHLLPHSSKQITATFESKKKLELVDEKFDLALKVIEHVGEVVDWDESSTTVSWVAVGKDGAESLANTGTSESPSPKRRGNKKVVEPTPEPEVTVKEGSDQNVPLLISANSDALVYELETDSIKLKNTMMFQTRAFSFPFKNTSTVPLEFSWAFEKDGEDPWEVAAQDGSEPVPLPDPFVIEPATGTVAPGQSINVQVHFSPQEAGSYGRRLVAKIPHLDTRPPPGEEPEPVVEAAPVAVDPKAKGKAPAAAAPVAPTKVALPDVMQPPSLTLTARAMRPLCHFELVESDWISGGRRPSGLPGPGGKSSLDPSTRVVEFESLGTKVRNTKRFFVTNPTNQSYEYAWECEDGTGAAALLQQRTFRCAQRKGVVLAGKKAEMVFEYTPEEDMLLESFWRFNIPEHNISVPVVLVGHVKEPSVAFSAPFLNFNAILVGAKASQTVNIVNKEHLPFQFNIDPQSLGGDSGGPALVVTPMTGMVSPGSSFPLLLTFSPKSESIFNINVSCSVRNKVSRLTLNVKGEGFVIRATVTVDDSDASSTQIMVPNRPFPLKYGQVYLKEKKVKVVSITNGGKYPFDYTFQRPDSRHITIIPEASVVPKGETVQAQVIFYPTVETSIESCVSLLQLTNGPKFPFTFSGLGRRPALRFSSQKIEFGHCFLHQQGLEAPSYVLKLVNEDASDISFDLLFDNKPHLEVDATPAILKPGDSIDINVSFMPREVTSYSEVLAFEVNGMYTINVSVTGEGEERLVQLANPAQSTIDLGSVLVNSMQNRTFKIVNKSHANAKCSLADSAKALLERSITIRPTEFNLRGKTSIDIEMFFSPKSRMVQFSSDVVLEVSGVPKQLMVISGRATGLETKLETDTLFFGAVVANSRAVRRVALENTGDVGARFKWDAARFAPAFSVKPVEGFLPSHGEITFEVAFHPTQVNDDIRYEKIPLNVEGGDGHALTLTGMCVTQAPVAEPIAFNIAARQLQTKASPAVANPTDVPWTIKPVFDHEYWTGAETLDIPAGKSVTYDIKFKPLAMAAADKPHKGSLFLPLPNGTALLYQLVGVVSEPAVEGEMDLTTKAKEALVIPIKAVNWLKRSQRFKVTIELDSSNPAVSLKGPEFIDVPGLLQRECKLKFYSYVEGSFKAKVTLTNEDSKEFQFFKVAIKATTPDVFGKASIEATVRSSASHAFSIDNSLSADVTLKCSSNNPDLRVPPTLLLPARSTRMLDVTYRPLLAGQGSAKVEATCAELGTFVFDVAVKAAAAGADRSLSFRAPLGTTDVQTFRFNHLLKDKADYKVTVDGADFVVDSATVAAPAAASDDGSEVSVDVRFEPTGLGERNGRLLLSSPAAGDFICILKGSAQPPRPQGPIEVKAAGGATVNFKNVYPKATTFSITCDNPAFVPANKGGEFAPKANQAIALTFKAPAPGASAIGKLQITGGGSTWVYYLKGV